MGKYKFGVYEYRATDANEILLRKQLIVLKDENQNIVGWTDFHKYARSGKRTLSRSIYAGQDKRCVYVSEYLTEQLTNIMPKTTTLLSKYFKANKIDYKSRHNLADFLLSFLPGELAESTDLEISSLMEKGYEVLQIGRASCRERV